MTDENHNIMTMMMKREKATKAEKFRVQRSKSEYLRLQQIELQQWQVTSVAWIAVHPEETMEYDSWKRRKKERK